jgi:hypothetical protein
MGLPKYQISTEVFGLTNSFSEIETPFSRTESSEPTPSNTGDLPSAG